MCASLYTGSSVRNGLVEVWGCFSRYYNNNTFLSVPACTDMIYSKELERDVTTTGMAKELQRLKTLASFH